jgi:hypothetical protein
MVLGSGIRKKPIPDPGSRGQKGTGSRIRIRNTGSDVCFMNYLLDEKLKHSSTIGTLKPGKAYRKKGTYGILFLSNN